MVAGKSDLPGFPFRKNSAKCRMQRSLKEPTCTDLVPRIHGELLKLGIDVGQTSDSPVTVVELFFAPSRQRPTAVRRSLRGRTGQAECAASGPLVVAKLPYKVEARKGLSRRKADILAR
jgi:hypothetical protein